MESKISPFLASETTCKWAPIPCFSRMSLAILSTVSVFMASKIEGNLGSYSNTSYQASSYPAQKSSQSFQSSSKPGSTSTSFPPSDSQTSILDFRDIQAGAASFGSQAGSYPRDNSASQTGFNPKTFRNSTDVSSSLQNSLTGQKLVDNFSNMSVNEGSTSHVSQHFAWLSLLGNVGQRYKLLRVSYCDRPLSVVCHP